MHHVMLEQKGADKEVAGSLFSGSLKKAFVAKADGTVRHKAFMVGGAVRFDEEQSDGFSSLALEGM